MKIFFFIFGVVVLGISTFFIAARANVESRVVLSSDDVHSGILFAAADTIIIDGVVNGDAYFAANQVVINGAVNGDVFALGNTIRINGRVSDDVRVGGSDIEFNGAIGKNVTVAGRNVLFAKSSDIAGSVVIASQNSSFAGTVGKDIYLAGQTGSISGFIGGAVKARSESMTIQRDAKINGLFAITIPEQKLVVVEGSLVRGGIVERALQPPVQTATNRAFKAITTTWFLLSTVLLGVVVLMLFPRQSDALIGFVRERPWHMLGWGVIWCIVTPVIIIALLASIVGAIIGLLILFGYIFALLLTQVVITYFIGRHFVVFILKRTMHRVWCMFIGIIIYYLVLSVPLVGPPVMVIGIVISLGAIFSLLREAMIRFSDHRKHYTNI